MSYLRNALRQFVSDRKRSYARVFNRESRDARAVLVDLARFCRAFESTFDPDPRVHAVKEGRREVFLRIAQHIELSDDDLWSLYSGNQPVKEPTDG